MNENIKNYKLSKALQLELQKTEARPSWESRNEGVHERVNFDDTIWGFNLAGGAFYKTPLRVTQVKENSRAEHAGIKVGDVLKSINDIQTSTLTVQEAHDLILECGVQIKLSFSAPDIEETMHCIYEDDSEEDLRERKRVSNLKNQNKGRKFNGAKTVKLTKEMEGIMYEEVTGWLCLKNEAWSIAWPPCGKKRDVIYRESNCFLVPSNFEAKHAERIKGPSTKTNESAL